MVLSGAIGAKGSSETVFECPTAIGYSIALGGDVAKAMWWDGMTRSINYFDSKWGEGRARGCSFRFRPYMQGFRISFYGSYRSSLSLIDTSRGNVHKNRLEENICETKEYRSIVLVFSTTWGKIR